MEKNRIKMIVEIDNLTIAQAVGLKTLFREFESFGKMGHSDWISFFADGDGDFRPKVECFTSSVIPNISREIYNTVEVSDKLNKNDANNFTSGSWFDCDLIHYLNDFNKKEELK